MTAATLATLTAGLHITFIVFVIAGGVLVQRWPRIIFLHVPAFLWGAFVEITGIPCPLTALENTYRALALEQRYDVSFLEHYLLPLIYPELLLGRALPPGFFVAIGVAVLAINAAVYWTVFKARR